MKFLSLACFTLSLTSGSAIAITFEFYKSQRDSIIEKIRENHKTMEMPRDRLTKSIQVEAVRRFRRVRTMAGTETPLHPHDIRMLKKELRIGKAMSMLKNDFTRLDLLNDYRSRVRNIEPEIGLDDKAKLEMLMNEKLQTWSTQSAPMSSVHIDEYFYRLQSIEEIIAKYEYEPHGPPKLSRGITTKSIGGKTQQLQPGHGTLAKPIK